MEDVSEGKRKKAKGKRKKAKGKRRKEKGERRRRKAKGERKGKRKKVKGKRTNYIKTTKNEEQRTKNEEQRTKAKGEPPSLKLRWSKKAKGKRKMKTIKNYSVVIGIVIIILVPVVIRSLGNNFRPDAEKHAAASLSGANVLTGDQVAALGADRLLVILDTPEKFSGISGKRANIQAGSLTEKAGMKMLRQNKGPVVLCSGDPSVSAGAWMVLSQMGVKNLYILSDGNDEVMKHEFRPENASGPEFL